MSYFYTDPTRETDPHSLPDVEVFHITASEFINADSDTWLAERMENEAADAVAGWFYAFGSPGCLWDSEPVGPFDTEEEALEAVREAAGLCPHGHDDETVCWECPAPELWVLEFGPNRFAAWDGETDDITRTMAWGSEAQAKASQARMAFCDLATAVRLPDDAARCWGQERGLNALMAARDAAAE